MNRLKRYWHAVIQGVVLYPVAGLTAVFLAGTIFWGGFNWSLELTNTETFCTTCHVMRVFPYEELKTTIHFSNRTGVRASCSDCHVPRKWIYKVSRKIRATNELYQWLVGSVDTPEEYEAKRPELARKVWASMKQSNSRECRNCHDIDSMDQKLQTPKASVMHTLARQWKKTCIDCHQGIAHVLPRDFDKTAIMGELHDRMAEEKIDCRRCHKSIAGAKAGDGW